MTVRSQASRNAPCGNTCDESSPLNVPDDYCACANNSAIPHRYARRQYCAGEDRDVISDPDRCEVVLFVRCQPMRFVHRSTRENHYPRAAIEVMSDVDS